MIAMSLFAKLGMGVLVMGLVIGVVLIGLGALVMRLDRRDWNPNDENTTPR